ncbi:hypothetical protein BDQ17DRAFT_1472270, partial [Cyathus striatus]
ILVLCYSLHTTHVYQGLNVIFLVLKQHLSLEHNKFTQTHAEDITKKNFLKIYGNTHITVLTVENIKATFQKTGVHPFDPIVVTPAMLASSMPKLIQSNLLT